MRRATTMIVALALGLLLAHSAFASGAVRISQLYGGGGGSGTYQYDYVELFNSSGAAVNIGGWSIQYGSATGTSFGSSSANMAVIPAGTTIGPCGYYLIQCGAAGTVGAALPVTPDLVNSTGPSMSQSTGKLALIKNSTGNNACSGNTSGVIYADVVGFGTGNCFEGAVSGTLSNSTVALRKLNGVQDTDNNANDFTQPSVAGVTIHNSHSAQDPGCLVTPTHTDTWGQLKLLYR